MVDYAGDSLLVANDNFAVPTPGTTDSTTTYTNQCTNVPSGTNSSLIAFAAELDSRSEAYIHHYTISGYPLPNCQGTKSLFGVWTPGNIPVVLPPTVGFPVGADFGSSHAYQSFKLNTHFDNPTSVSGIIDSSGLRLYLTPNDTRREIEAGVLQLGDPDVALQSGADTFIAPGNTKHDFRCGATATTAWAHDITVVTHFLHMHAIGIKQETIVTRGTATVFHGEIEFYEFALQSPVGRPNGYTLQRGDSINTTCYYTHSGGATSKKWGLSSEDEMCIDYVSRVITDWCERRVRGERGEHATHHASLRGPPRIFTVSLWMAGHVLPKVGGDRKVRWPRSRRGVPGEEHCHDYPKGLWRARGDHCSVHSISNTRPD